MSVTVTILVSVCAYESDHRRVRGTIPQNKTVARILVRISFGYD